MRGKLTVQIWTYQKPRCFLLSPQGGAHGVSWAFLLGMQSNDSFPRASLEQIVPTMSTTPPGMPQLTLPSLQSGEAWGPRYLSLPWPTHARRPWAAASAALYWYVSQCAHSSATGTSMHGHSHRYHTVGTTLTPFHVHSILTNNLHAPHHPLMLHVVRNATQRYSVHPATIVISSRLMTQACGHLWHQTEIEVWALWSVVTDGFMSHWLLFLFLLFVIISRLCGMVSAHRWRAQWDYRSVDCCPRAAQGWVACVWSPPNYSIQIYEGCISSRYMVTIQVLCTGYFTMLTNTQTSTHTCMIC